MKTLVVYYSWTGSTEVVAFEIAKGLGADLMPLEEQKPRLNDGGASFGRAAMQAVFGIKTSLKKETCDLSDYDRIFIGTPIWAGKHVPAINTFLQKNRFDGKKVYLFITHADDKPPKAIDILTNRVEDKGGEVEAYFMVRTVTNKKIDAAEVIPQVQKWIEEIQG